MSMLASGYGGENRDLVPVVQYRVGVGVFFIYGDEEFVFCKGWMLLGELVDKEFGGGGFIGTELKLSRADGIGTGTEKKEIYFHLR